MLNDKIDYIKSPEGKIVAISVNGKPVKPSSMRGFKKAQETSYWKLFIKNGVGCNQFSGEEVELNELELTIFVWCMDWAYGHYYCNLNPEAPIQTFDDMKYFLLELNADAYMALLD